MKKIAVLLFCFGASFASSSLFLLWEIARRQRTSIIFALPPHKTVLVVGDSHPECAIDDRILESVVNLSRSGDTYFYSYLKIRAVLEHNPQIETVVLSYSYAELSESRDDWFKGTTQIGDRLPKFLPLLNYRDFLRLFRANPYAVVANIPRSSRSGFRRILKTKRGYFPFRTMRSFGHYRPLRQDRLQEAKNRRSTVSGEGANPDAKQPEVKGGQYQRKHLKEIYLLLRAREKNVILLNVPVHPWWAPWLDAYEDYNVSFAREQLPHALVVDHSQMEIPEMYFRDFGHLNYEGAKLYSEYLKNHAIFSAPSSDDTGAD